MPNAPHADTVTVSFTLPKALSDAVNRAARSQLTNKSDIIRRALLAYLPADERARVMGAVTWLTGRNGRNGLTGRNGLGLKIFP